MPNLRQRLGAQSVIPAKRGKKNWRIHGVRAEMRQQFPRRIYRRRALIESLFSSVKRKLSARAPGRSLRTQRRQALLLGLSFNLYRLRHRYRFLGCQQSQIASSDVQGLLPTIRRRRCDLTGMPGHFLSVILDSSNARRTTYVQECILDKLC
jgi:hypothetical protein